jgi:hypothetical protein
MMAWPMRARVGPIGKLAAKEAKHEFTRLSRIGTDEYLNAVLREEGQRLGPYAAGDDDLYALVA